LGDVFDYHYDDSGQFSLNIDLFLIQ